MGPHGGGGESMSPGGISACQGAVIVPGAAPMGAGLLPSTGATGAGKMGGNSPARGRVNRHSTVVLYHMRVILSRKIVIHLTPKTGKMG